MPQSGIQLDMFTRILGVFDEELHITPGGLTNPGGTIIIPSIPGRSFPPVRLGGGGGHPPPPPTNGLSVIFGAGADDAP